MLDKPNGYSERSFPYHPRHPRQIPPRPHRKKDWMQINELSRMKVGELREKYIEVFGEQTRSFHKDYLRKRIAWRIQALAEGDLSERARRRAEELANDADLRIRTPRDPLGPYAEPEKARPTASHISNARDPRLFLPGEAR
jgi:hypothetical protein